MTRYVTVRVVGTDGRPKEGREISIGGAGFFGSVGKRHRTGSDGSVEIATEHSGNIDIYVDGTKRVSDEPIRSHFTITLR